ncbi:MAG: sensor histidine kinase [Crocinitomicaceae bacterium]|nr:sensor histidine kinase [Crocinitomicaceae bacterium]
MISFKPPKTNYESIDDIGKFNMIWSVSTVLVLIFSMLTVLHIVMSDPSWVSSGLGLTVAVTNVLVLYKTRKYKLIGITSVIFGTLICQVAIFIIADSRLIADTMWCILVGFFAFFLLGTWLGTLTLLANLAGLVIFLLNGSSHDVLSKGISIDEVDYRMAINVFYVALAMAFIIHKLSSNNKETNRRFELESQRNEILLKEIHHRVKNNLQIISSLLKLQAADSENESVEEHFNEAIGRIRSMALIHEKMYNNDDLSKIDLKGYLIAMSDDICASMSREGDFKLNVHSDIDQIDIKSIVPVSLIFNELMTNTLKHGFKEVKDGVIDVEMRRNNGSVDFVYKDNGKWIEPTSEGNFGLELLNTLTEQLEGKFTRQTTSGTQYNFKFNSEVFFFEGRGKA